ncbi:MAG: C39 family peptidase [Candidatus Levybacteria bacterium]|nr:C39 family peptidase [Candidatus Levybacteria bacterium]
MRYDKIVVGGLTFLSLYILFWLWFFDTPKPHKNIINIPKNASVFNFVENNSLVLGSRSYPQPVLSLPSSHKISIDLRRQSFNLSCEFAAAASIIYHFTNDPDFSVMQELTAEKTLINKVAISRNPNVGLRMGDGIALENLYVNLNKWFGESEYYGIHAPPFIDLFANYKLAAKPIYINDSTIALIKEALSNGHLIMAWIKIGYTRPVDERLAYGKVKIIRGEHSIVINGYDESGVVVMDPGIGLERHIDYSSLIEASASFSMPFLEVYKNIDNKISLDNLTVGFDTLTGIDRSIPKIYVKNGAGEVGVANQMRDILKDFGYSISSVSNADNFDYQDISIQAKKVFSDYLFILNRDIKLAGYIIASSSADLAEDDVKDAVIIVGR